LISERLSAFFSHAASAENLNLTIMFDFSVFVSRTSLTFNDILPENPKAYDKMRPPKKDGAPTTVFFHVTVMGLDSIDETSMVMKSSIFTFKILLRKIFYRHMLLTYFSHKRGKIIG
jgi:hypothetical protein